MKILYVIPEYPPHAGGGIVTWYQCLIPEMARRGHQVRVIVGSGVSSEFSDYDQNDVRVQFLDPTKVSTRIARFNQYQMFPYFQRHLTAAWLAWEMSQGEEYDIVETTDWGMLFVPWVICNEAPPTVVQLHGSIGQIDYYDPKQGEEVEGNLVRLLEMQLLSAADGLQTYSHSNRVQWRGLTERDITHIPPAWIPDTSIDFDSNADNEVGRGLVVGRIQHWKGPATLCEALRLLSKDAPSINWVGRDTNYKDVDTSMSAYLTRTYPDVWQAIITPVGARSPQETASLQQDASFVIVPSLWDVFNFTCIEAMGYGKVVICSEGAGAAGLIQHGENGLIFPAGDAEALSDCIRHFLNMDVKARQRMGQAAREHILSELSPTRIAEEREAAYRNLILHHKRVVKHNDWVIKAVSPQEPLQRPLAFLDKLPLKQIGSYAANRSLHKFLHRS